MTTPSLFTRTTMCPPSPRQVGARRCAAAVLQPQNRPEAWLASGSLGATTAELGSVGLGAGGEFAFLIR